MEEQLANRPESVQHVFTIGHDPAFKVAVHDCLDNDPVTRDAFWFDLTAAGGRVYFAGHVHFFDVARIDDGNRYPDRWPPNYRGPGGAPLYADGAYRMATMDRIYPSANTMRPIMVMW